MNERDIEIAKINNSEIKRLESKLALIDNFEKNLLEDFDKSLDRLFSGNLFVMLLEEVKNIPNLDKIPTKTVTVNNITYKIPTNFLQVFHMSYIKNKDLKMIYDETLKDWFSSKTDEIKKAIKNVNSYENVASVLPAAYALSSLAITTFHKRPNMILRDVQKLAGIGISEGSIIELGTGEGKTLSAVLPLYLEALRGKGAHLITANGYLAKRDYEETLPIFEGLGLTSGFLPESEIELAQIEGKDPAKLTILERYEYQEKLRKIKQEAYRKDITYGSKSTFAFDYLRDNSIRRKEEMIQREERPGFALIDEVDDALIDDAEVPYRIATTTPMYRNNMSIKDLCFMQGIKYEEVIDKIRAIGIKNDILTYEEARYISKMFGSKELIPDPMRYQEAAQRFFNQQKVLTVEDNMYGFKTAKDLYEALLDEDKYDADKIRKTYGIIFCKELKEYKVSDKCYEDFLKYCYFSFQINSVALASKDKILKDRNYQLDVDYVTDSNTDQIILTMKGANKLLNDSNYPEFIEDYNKYMNLITPEAAILLHYFQQAIGANLIMKKEEDYIVDGNTIKVLKNGRIQEGSTYSNGLHQALEIKEKINREYRTKENSAVSTVTQKDFYQRYDLMSGMTGTSSKEVFESIFGKDTLEVPKHAFYSYFSSRKRNDAKEPFGILKKNAKFAMDTESKINLIVSSIIESRNKEPKQPVLLVVSNVDEIALLQRKLESINIPFNTLTSTTSKEDEALIIAKAGLPGAVTISTEMSGRGTDIKVGGDRETIIDIATKRHIRRLEEGVKRSLSFTRREKDFLRKKVEDALTTSPSVNLWTKEEELRKQKEMETTGLKVISSGFFQVSRIDRQLEGRTGRNGISGICERFVSIEDIKRIGVSSFGIKESLSDFFSKFRKNTDGSLDIDQRSYTTIMDKIKARQKENEAVIKNRIEDTQKLDSYATILLEKYRDERRKIVCEDVDISRMIKDMVETSIDSIISTYITDDELQKEKLLKPINNGGINVDMNALSLEIKQVLGISFDSNVVLKSNMNTLELRDALIRTMKQKIKTLSSDELQRALIVQNDYLLANIPEILEHSFLVRRLHSISIGMQERVDYEGDMAFEESRRKILAEASREALKATVGTPLSVKEFKELEVRKVHILGESIEKSKDIKGGYEVKKAKNKENNISIIDRIKQIKKEVDKKNQKKLEKVEAEVDRLKQEGKEIDIKKLYSRIDVRPMKFMSAMQNGKEISKLVIVREKRIEETDQRSVSLH